jgi:pSer/pThr/pTyr-binding forkhead associated (FHA) protein/tetratricopeptide (TPR) repeat protein
MNRLTVFQSGNKVAELILSDSREYIVGRAESSDLVLQGERGISRQHLKISPDGSGQWTVEVLSRYGELYLSGKKVSSIVLKDGAHFEVPPFEFRFEADQQPEFEEEVSPQPVQARPAAESELSPDISDRTFVGQAVMTAFLKLKDESGQVVRIYQLEGNSWVAGRDTSCAIYIDNPQFSRRHFEIRIEEGAYLIKDLGSSNGTLLDQDLLPADKWIPIWSGQTITVVDWSLGFEIRDASFERKLQEIPLDLQNPLYVSPQVGSGAYPQPESLASSPAEPQFNIVRVLILLLVVGGGLFYFMDSPSPQAVEGPAKPTSSPFEKLTPQQQQYVKDTYRLADRLFKEGRYEMARQEVAKIHQLIPVFEESKNLEKLAEVAIQTQVEQQRVEAREKERLEMEDKIQKTVAECSRKVTPRVENAEIDECLSSVIPLNPDHPLIVELKARVDQVITDRMAREERNAEYQALVRRQRALYSKAEVVLKSGQPLEAITAFEKVVASKLPDPQNLKGQAKRQMASIQRDLAGRQAELEREADDHLKRQDLKQAILTLQKASKINPDNETIKGRIHSSMSELRKQMMVLYQEGVLEESVGEIETAKAKWKKIVESSVPDEEYFRKAKSKLKKYGAD